MANKSSFSRCALASPNLRNVPPPSSVIGPPKKSWDKLVPTKQMIYRPYEIVGVYGTTLKKIIHKKFEDGIINKIDLSMHIVLINKTQWITQLQLESHVESGYF